MAAEERPPRAPSYAASMSGGEEAVVVSLSSARPGTSDEDDHAVPGDDQPVRSGQGGFAPTAKGVWLGTKLLAGGLLAAWVIAWPVGMTMVHQAQTGVFRLQFGYSPDMLFMALATVGLILGAGYSLAAGVRLEAAAQRLTRSLGTLANGIGHPKEVAAQAQVSALNGEIDKALGKLAEAESVIRQQVRWIDTTTNAISEGVIESTDRLEAATKALMDQTEEINREAERCAETIAEQTKLSGDASTTMTSRIDQKSQELDSQLQRLEAVSHRSLERFESLAGMMEERGSALDRKSAETTERQTAIAGQLDENQGRLEKAKASLLEQSSRLEDLIKDQRRRADRLANAISAQSDRLARVEGDTETGKSRRGLAWRDILATVEDALPAGSKGAAAPRPSAAVPAASPAAPTAPSAAPHAAVNPGADDGAAFLEKLAIRVQNFSLVLHTQLFGGPTHEQLDRFEAGERQLFAKVLLDQDMDLLKARITAETSKNDVFAERVREYLKDFDALLAPLASGGDEAIEAYLAAPMGRLYVLIGETVGHFG